MFWNKVAGAVLITAITAMVASLVGNALVAPKSEHGPKTERKQEKELPWNGAIVSASISDGEDYVRGVCGRCHGLNPGENKGTGPNLLGVVGRKRAGDPAYSKYSSSLNGKGGTWDYKSLYEFLRNPNATVPGVDAQMGAISVDWKNAGAVVKYLASKSPNAGPLPKWEPPKEEKKDDDKTDGPKKDEPKKH
jgi:cytochrome c